MKQISAGCTAISSEKMATLEKHKRRKGQTMGIVSSRLLLFMVN
jgi:hypothetical protein